MRAVREHLVRGEENGVEQMGIEVVEGTYGNACICCFWGREPHTDDTVGFFVVEDYVGDFAQ